MKFRLGELKNNAISKAVFGGFQVSGITVFQSGQPFTILTGVDSNGNGAASSDRPNFNPNGIFMRDPVTGDLRTFTSPLVGGAFVVPLGKNGLPLANSLGNGDLGKKTFRTPGFWNSDLSLMKRSTFCLGAEKTITVFNFELISLMLLISIIMVVREINEQRGFCKNLNNWGNCSIMLSEK